MNEHDLMRALERRAAGVDPAGAPVAEMVERATAVRRRRTAVSVVAVAAAVAVVATTVSLVGVGGDRTTAPDVVSPGGEGDSFAEALAVVPAGSGLIAFNNRAAAAARLGLTAASPAAYAAELFAYLDRDAAAVETGGVFTPLSVYLEQMADLPVNDTHVVWSVGGDTGEASAIGLAGFTIYKVTPETDLDAVADDLVAAGLEEDDLLGRRHLVADSPADVTSPSGLIGDGYPTEFLEVTIDPAADLLIIGNTSESILEVLDGGAESAADAGTVSAVVGDLTDVERASVTTATSCFGEPEGVREPEGTGIFVSGRDAEVEARLVFADEAAASADIPVRTDFIESRRGGDGEAILGEVEVVRDGARVAIRFDDVLSGAVDDLTQVPGSILGC